MADYFGVEFPSPFDREYVDPASARTIARLLQEDMSGQRLPPGAPLDNLEYNPADAVAIARILEEDERHNLTAPQSWDGFDSTGGLSVQHHPAPTAIATNSVWSLRDPVAGDRSPVQPPPYSEMDYPMHGADSGAHFVDAEHTIPRPISRTFVSGPNSAHRLTPAPFGSPGPPESTLGQRSRENENQSPEKRQRLCEERAHDLDIDALDAHLAELKTPSVPVGRVRTRTNRFNPTPVGFTCEENSLMPLVKPELASNSRPASFVPGIFGDGGELSDQNAHITAWIDGVNKSYGGRPAKPPSVNQAHVGFTLAEASSVPGSTLADGNPVKPDWQREHGPDNEEALVNIEAPKEQMPSHPPQDIPTTHNNQPQAQEFPLTDSDDDVLSLSTCDSISSEDEPLAISGLPQRGTIGQLRSASASTDTIRIGAHELSTRPSPGPQMPPSSTDKGKQRASESPCESGGSSDSEWSMLDEDRDEFILVRHQSGSSADSPPLTSHQLGIYQKPLELEKCLLCNAAFEHLNDLGEVSNSAPVGTRLHCPGRHAYCAECIARYFFSNLANGCKGISDVPCPNCTASIWRFDEQEAGRVLAPLPLE